MNVPRKVYTDAEVTRARNTAQVVGWAQGAGAVVLAGVAWQLLGWIPVVLVLGAVAWVLYRLFAGGRREDGDRPGP